MWAHASLWGLINIEIYVYVKLVYMDLMAIRSCLLSFIDSLAFSFIKYLPCASSRIFISSLAFNCIDSRVIFTDLVVFWSSISIHRPSDGPLALARLFEITGLYLAHFYIASLVPSSSIWTSASLWGIIYIEIVYIKLVYIDLMIIRSHLLPLID